MRAPRRHLTRSVDEITTCASEALMARSRNGQAISPGRRTRAAQRRLVAFLREAEKRGDLTGEQLGELAAVVSAGPEAAGYNSGVWTGPMIGDWIQREYGVKYHNHHIPRLLHRLGFSVQRPRKRLARADLEKQEYWLRARLPAIKKKRPRAEG